MERQSKRACGWLLPYAASKEILWKSLMPDFCRELDMQIKVNWEHCVALGSDRCLFYKCRSSWKAAPNGGEALTARSEGSSCSEIWMDAWPQVPADQLRCVSLPPRVIPAIWVFNYLLFVCFRCSMSKCCMGQGVNVFLKTVFSWSLMLSSQAIQVAVR